MGGKQTINKQLKVKVKRQPSYQELNVSRCLNTKEQAALVAGDGSGGVSLAEEFGSVRSKSPTPVVGRAKGKRGGSNRTVYG